MSIYLDFGTLLPELSSFIFQRFQKLSESEETMGTSEHKHWKCSMLKLKSILISHRLCFPPQKYMCILHIYLHIYIYLCICKWATLRFKMFHKTKTFQKIYEMFKYMFIYSILGNLRIASFHIEGIARLHPAKFNFSKSARTMLGYL